jgi:hypothetical protein
LQQVPTPRIIQARRGAPASNGRGDRRTVVETEVDAADIDWVVKNYVKRSAKEKLRDGTCTPGKVLVYALTDAVSYTPS